MPTNCRTRGFLAFAENLADGLEKSLDRADISPYDISEIDRFFRDGVQTVDPSTGPSRRLPPLNPSEFHILLALADAQRHGYGIMLEVEKRSGGTVRLGPGTLYGAIKRMLAAGLIEVSDRRPSEHDDDRRRCYYRLTPFGRKVAAGEARRLAALVRVAQGKRLISAGPLAPDGGDA